MFMLKSWAFVFKRNLFRLQGINLFGSIVPDEGYIGDRLGVLSPQARLPVECRDLTGFIQGQPEGLCQLPGIHHVSVLVISVFMVARAGLIFEGTTSKYSIPELKFMMAALPLS